MASRIITLFTFNTDANPQTLTVPQGGILYAVHYFCSLEGGGATGHGTGTLRFSQKTYDPTTLAADTSNDDILALSEGSLPTTAPTILTGLSRLLMQGQKLYVSYIHIQGASPPKVYHHVQLFLRDPPKPRIPPEPARGPGLGSALPAPPTSRVKPRVLFG